MAVPKTQSIIAPHSVASLRHEQLQARLGFLERFNERQPGWGMNP